MAASLSAFGKKGLFRSQKWLHLMRELPCAVCGSEDGTVVAAHRNEGKGMGLKVSDCLVIPLCFVCHREFDQGGQSREAKRDTWNRAYIDTIEKLISEGRLVLK